MHRLTDKRRESNRQIFLMALLNPTRLFDLVDQEFLTHDVDSRIHYGFGQSHPMLTTYFPKWSNTFRESSNMRDILLLIKILRHNFQTVKRKLQRAAATKSQICHLFCLIILVNRWFQLFIYSYISIIQFGLTRSSYNLFLHLKQVFI